MGGMCLATFCGDLIAVFSQYYLATVPTSASYTLDQKETNTDNTSRLQMTEQVPRERAAAISTPKVRQASAHSLFTYIAWLETHPGARAMQIQTGTHSHVGTILRRFGRVFRQRHCFENGEEKISIKQVTADTSPCLKRERKCVYVCVSSSGHQRRPRKPSRRENHGTTPILVGTIPSSASTSVRQHREMPVLNTLYSVCIKGQIKDDTICQSWKPITLHPFALLVGCAGRIVVPSRPEQPSRLHRGPFRMDHFPSDGSNTLHEGPPVMASNLF